MNLLNLFSKKPKKDAQEQIRLYLLSGKRLTVVKALKLFGTTEMRSIKSRLIKSGLPIKAVKVPGESYCEYFLDQVA